MREEAGTTDRHPWLAALACLVASSALILQYLLLLANAEPDVGPGLLTLRFFSYFTILSNLLVAVATGLALAMKPALLARFFAQPRVRGGIALYIGVTGLVYLVVLRQLWQPVGAQWWADTALHYLVPLLYLAWWLIGTRHGAIRWGDLAWWLLFPLVFLAWSLVRGAWLHEYPYPFIDVDALGMTVVLRNAVGMLVLFLVAGGLLFGIDRVLGRRPSASEVAS